MPIVDILHLFEGFLREYEAEGLDLTSRRPFPEAGGAARSRPPATTKAGHAGPPG